MAVFLDLFKSQSTGGVLHIIISTQQFDPPHLPRAIKVSYLLFFVALSVSIYGHFFFFLATLFFSFLPSSAVFSLSLSDTRRVKLYPKIMHAVL